MIDDRVAGWGDIRKRAFLVRVTVLYDWPRPSEKRKTRFADGHRDFRMALVFFSTVWMEYYNWQWEYNIPYAHDLPKNIDIFFDSVWVWIVKPKQLWNAQSHNFLIRSHHVSEQQQRGRTLCSAGTTAQWFIRPRTESGRKPDWFKGSRKAAFQNLAWRCLERRTNLFLASSTLAAMDL